MIKKINKILNEVCTSLNSESWNYHVNIQLFDCGNTGQLSANSIVKHSLGNEAIIGGTFSAVPSEIIQDLRNGLEYSGDSSSYPNNDALTNSTEISKRKEIVTLIENYVSESTMVMGLWLKNGHPFYPVFWDFAYIIEHGKSGSLLIGSSSD